VVFIQVDVCNFVPVHISIATFPAFSNNVLKANSFSVPEGDCVEEDEMGGECGVEEKRCKVWVENLKVGN
jgi:hypothetical protein